LISRILHRSGFGRLITGANRQISHELGKTSWRFAEAPKTPKLLMKEIFMKGNQKVISTLNDLLADELTAINQYMVHSEMCANWGYEKLHEKAEKRAIHEMKHAEELIERILFLDGMPNVSTLKSIHIGKSVDNQFKNDLEAEEDAVRAYNEGIRLAREEDDNGTRDLLESILKDEEEHLDWLEAQLFQIEQMGLSIYLVEQLD
jgi:bacterioferritin